MLLASSQDNIEAGRENESASCVLRLTNKKPVRAKSPRTAFLLDRMLLGGQEGEEHSLLGFSTQ